MYPVVPYSSLLSKISEKEGDFNSMDICSVGGTCEMGTDGREIANGGGGI